MNSPSSSPPTPDPITLDPITLVVATGNPGKLKEMQRYLATAPVRFNLQLKPPELEVEETGTTFAENAALKATQVAQATQNWAIADDSGLMVDVLGGAPGVYSARYGADQGARTDADRLQLLLQTLEEREAIQGSIDRGAQFVCAVTVARPDGSIAFATEGICRGVLTRSPQGDGGFGYDPIFSLPDRSLTFAEMTPDQKRQFSHRGQAFEQLIPHLPQIFSARHLD